VHSTARDRSFERLYRRHRREVYGAVLRDVRDPDEAEDVTQIAFMNAFRAIRRGEEPEKPRAWLVTIARNVVRRRYQVQAARPHEVALDPDAAASLIDLEGPTAGEIAAAIRCLPAKQRAVILLREIQGRAYAEIAEELDLSMPAVETLIFRARRSLSEQLRLADRVPTTRDKRARRLRGLLPLPLPGLSKLSFGFSRGRASVAALVGSIAIVAVPVTDVPADPPRAPDARQVPPLAEARTLFASPTAGPAPSLQQSNARPARASRVKTGPGAETAPGEGGSASLPILGTTVDPAAFLPVDPTTAVPVDPTTLVPDAPSLLPLPVEPPELPPLPPPPTLG
jgi:RNA polymerase sigma-70 factor, ECF subfamily